MRQMYIKFDADFNFKNHIRNSYRRYIPLNLVAQIMPIAAKMQ